MLINALLECEEPDVCHAAIERSGHLPITSEILEAAALRCTLPQFRYFWARAQTNLMSESLLKNAICNWEDHFDVFEYLLEDLIATDVGE